MHAKVDSARKTKTFSNNHASSFWILENDLHGLSSRRGDSGLGEAAEGRILDRRREDVLT